MDADSDTSSLMTLTPSLREALYRYQGSRKYQAANEDYLWPCDTTATTLELRIAYVLEKTFENGLGWEPRANAMADVLGVSSPDGPARVLDLGSGLTASWAIAMAERYPLAEVIGVDLISTELSDVPPNLSIEIYDLLEGLPYPDNYFNLIHCRFGGTSSTFLDNPNLDFLAEVARALRPGGVLLLMEVDDMLSPFRSHASSEPALARIQARHSLRFRATPPPSAVVAHADWGQRMGRLVRATEGFEDVHEADMDLPFGATSDESLSPHLQRGSVHRSGFIDAWELMGAAAGLDDATLQALRKEDEEQVPVEDVGVFVRIKVVWATRAGGRSSHSSSSGQQ